MISVWTGSPRAVSPRKSWAIPLFKSISQRWEMPALISSSRNLPAASWVVRRSEEGEVADPVRLEPGAGTAAVVTGRLAETSVL